MEPPKLYYNESWQQRMVIFEGVLELVIILIVIAISLADALCALFVATKSGSTASLLLLIIGEFLTTVIAATSLITVIIDSISKNAKSNIKKFFVLNFLLMLISTFLSIASGIVWFDNIIYNGIEQSTTKRLRIGVMSLFIISTFLKGPMLSFLFSSCIQTSVPNSASNSATTSPTASVRIFTPPSIAEDHRFAINNKDSLQTLVTDPNEFNYRSSKDVESNGMSYTNNNNDNGNHFDLSVSKVQSSSMKTQKMNNSGFNEIKNNNNNNENHFNLPLSKSAFYEIANSDNDNKDIITSWENNYKRSSRLYENNHIISTTDLNYLITSSSSIRLNVKKRNEKTIAHEKDFLSKISDSLLPPLLQQGESQIVNSKREFEKNQYLPQFALTQDHPVHVHGNSNDNNDYLPHSVIHEEEEEEDENGEIQKRVVERGNESSPELNSPQEYSPSRDVNVLDQLGDIPRSRQSSKLAEEAPISGKTQLNHISLQSWENNKDKWSREIEREEIGMGIYIQNSSQVQSVESEGKLNLDFNSSKCLDRSSSAPSLHSYRNGNKTPIRDLDCTESDYTFDNFTFNPGNHQEEEKREEEGEEEEEEEFNQLSMAPMESMKNAELFKYPQQLKELSPSKKSKLKLLSSTSTSLPSRRRSSSSSPLKRFNKRFFNSSKDFDNEDEEEVKKREAGARFSYISQQHHEMGDFISNNAHQHNYSTSAISLGKKSSPIKEFFHNHTKSTSIVNKPSFDTFHGLTPSSIGGKRVDSGTTKSTPDSEFSKNSGSTDSPCPYGAFGEYDKEKWRVIRLTQRLEQEHNGSLYDVESNSDIYKSRFDEEICL